jgi:glycosyltransferase involved in cell wall biosynthesis
MGTGLVARLRKSLTGKSRQQGFIDTAVLDAIASFASSGSVISGHEVFSALPQAAKSNAVTLLEAGRLLAATNATLAAQLAYHAALRCMSTAKAGTEIALLQTAAIESAARFMDINRPYEALQSLSLALQTTGSNNQAQLVRYTTFALDRIFANTGVFFWWHDVLQLCRNQLLVFRNIRISTEIWPDADGDVARTACHMVGLAPNNLPAHFLTFAIESENTAKSFDLQRKRLSGCSWRELYPQWQTLVQNIQASAPILALFAFEALTLGQIDQAQISAARAIAERKFDPLLCLLLSRAYDARTNDQAATVLCQSIDASFWGQCGHLVARLGGTTAQQFAEAALPKEHITGQGLLERVWALEELGRLSDAAQLLAKHLQTTMAVGNVLSGEVAEQCARVFAQMVLQSSSPPKENRWLHLCAAVTEANADSLSGERLANFLEACVVAKDFNALLACLANWVETEARLTDLFSSPAFGGFISRITETISFDSRYALGAKPVASALLDIASSLDARGNPDHSGAIYVLAALADKSRQGLCLAAGWALGQAGHFRAAELMFNGCGRVLGRPCRDIVWPKAGRTRWPHKPFFSPALFDDLLPVGKAWPLISIVIPSYNQGEFIEETVLSILNQGYPNTQIIIMDGGSNDTTMAVLEPYRDRIEVLISEPDRGQTHAINKGFAYAQGEVLAYLCSDDLYGPGALHRAALAWLETDADLMVGIIIAFRDYGFEAANRPAVREGGFTVAKLADIFGYWMKGHFFYEPEVFFSKKIWEKTGSYFNEKLFYTMDYEYWVRCAKFGATLASISWPFALFRQHEGQKTHRLVRTLCEQSQVRDTYLEWKPDAKKHCEILKKRDFALGASSSFENKRFLVASDVYSDVLALHCPDWTLVTSFDDLPQTATLVVAMTSPYLDTKSVEAWRNSNSEALLIGWAIANFQHHQANHDVAEVVDLLVPAHGFVASYLASQHSILTSPVSEPLRFDAPDLAGSQARSSAVWGYLRSEWLDKANLKLIDLIKADGDHALTISDTQTANFIAASLQSQHKVALVLSSDGEVSIDVFEALLLGQTVVVPNGLEWASYGMSELELSSSGIFTFAAGSLEAYTEAYKCALALFDLSGIDGIKTRSQFAQSQRSFKSQIARLIDTARAITAHPIN